ncbi:MAG TPA: hypothetical protein VGO11_11060 [Chthoniobacteraceae bacterium]|jgi:hypothetical protein|nr:hypothetical protein [Chthoniobacteraceae bacterium]
MIRKRLVRSSAVIASSFLSLLPHGVVKAQEGQLGKRLRDSVLSPTGFSITPLTPPAGPVPGPGQQQTFQWKTGIVTTTFWVGEKASKNNPVPNHASSWDAKWAQNYGGFDDPDRANRAQFIPAKFVPQQNPFYVALPYNDVTKGAHKPEASLVIPWFKKDFQAAGKSVCKGRWIAIRFKDRVCYAQWEDCGPFRTDHWQYVFGNERPKPNLNKGAGLDVSPAVRDYLGMNDTDVTDWKFCDFSEVTQGPWSQFGDNNTFVQFRRAEEVRTAKLTPPVASAVVVP